MIGKTALIVRSPSLHVGNYGEATKKMESLTSEVVNEILNGFSNNKSIICPICKAKFAFINQDIQAKSNFYYCAKCGFTFHKSRK